MSKTCHKCGFVNPMDTEFLSETECPKCGAIYKKVMAKRDGSNKVTIKSKNRYIMVGLFIFLFIVCTFVLLVTAPPPEPIVHNVDYEIRSIPASYTGTLVELKPESYKCKSVAAKKWLLDYTVKHGKLTEAQIYKAISNVSYLKREIKMHCKDASQVGKLINQSANSGVKPDWIKSEINNLIDYTAKSIR